MPGGSGNPQILRNTFSFFPRPLVAALFREVLMNREDLIGRRITRILRTDIDFVEGTGLPGVSRGVYEIFTLFLELDDCELLKFGSSRRSDPLTLLPLAERQQLITIHLPEEDSCLGETIRGVVVLYDSIALELSSGRYLRVEDDFDGTEIDLADADDIDETLLVDYWDPQFDAAE